MTKEEYYTEYKRIEYLISFNRSIHCERVAAKWERELNKLRKAWEAQNA